MGRSGECRPVFLDDAKEFWELRLHLMQPNPKSSTCFAKAVKYLLSGKADTKCEEVETLCTNLTKRGLGFYADDVREKASVVPDPMVYHHRFHIRRPKACLIQFVFILSREKWPPREECWIYGVAELTLRLNPEI